MSRILQLELDAWKHPAVIVQEVVDVLRRYPGRDPVELNARTRSDGASVRLRLGDGVRVAGHDESLRGELEQLTGNRPSFAWDS